MRSTLQSLLNVQCAEHGHRATECKLKGRGWILHRLLTSTSPNQQTPRQADPDNEKQPSQKKLSLEEKTEAGANVLLTSTYGPTRIRFQTIRAIAHGTDGKRMTVNCLYDSAAERTLVREDVAQTLRLAGPIQTITVKGIHGIYCHSAASRRIQLRLSPLKSHPHEEVNQPIEALTLTKIRDDIPSVPFRSKDWKHLERLHLPEERDMNLPIHILIGLDFYGRFLGEKILRVGHDDPIENEIERTLKKFWELDSIGIKPQEENPTQDSVSATFHSNLTHDGSRYTVGLQWKPGEIRLPDNRSLAEQRLQAIERSIMKDPAKQLAHSTVIEEYIQNGWVEESLWTLGLSWDSPLPPKISKQWRSWQEELKKISQIKLSSPWLSHSVRQVRKVELHMFGDASQAAYAACLFYPSHSHHPYIGCTAA
ncbi:hypothetical protein T02_3210 [Trichinella nativa]|uniref:Uncharacterized protein n=1 Tax=Trichinella nativa TaxID=6335 RepID=A0A0V1LA38_9BILA|nr:hypothetical protein T02_3210 [Trichinella nativa]